ncbi:MAG TPA: sugar phosphate isomerase/epimerase family protein [Tepidisphaeraceae bacterium]|nr:sugar phosphate isomerase/epimerase family protein [Tepidisphaeraceae bacterium]
MQLGFASAILPDLSLKEVADVAAAQGFDCVELMCWPLGKAERRYAGVTHVDVDDFGKAQAQQVLETMQSAGLRISGLGYYPNPLAPDRQEGQRYVEHIRKVIAASALLGVNQVNTFIGRDWTKSVDANWPRFLEVWKPLVKFAEDQGVRIGIENCPMYFTADEWPSGKNLAHCPAVWRRMFQAIPSSNFGLNYDPSHMIWQHMDYLKPLREFASRIFHVHAKDVKLDQDRLDNVGILATPLEYHRPKLPGLGEINWERFVAELRSTGYDGPVCIEVEDRDFEGSLEMRKEALKRSGALLRKFIPKAAR